MIRQTVAPQIVYARMPTQITVIVIALTSLVLHCLTSAYGLPTRRGSAVRPVSRARDRTFGRSPAYVPAANLTDVNTRYRLLDTLRGLAVAGILLVNACDITRVGENHIADGPPSGRTVLDLAVQSRFVPLFAMLFGVTMVLMVGSARRDGRHPAPALLLRMVVLGGIGVVHALFYSGDILREYAIVGLVMIPFAIWVSPVVSLTTGVIATAISFGFLSGAAESVPGLMLIGIGSAGLGVPAILDRGSPAVRLALAVAIPVALLALWMQLRAPGDPRFAVEGARAGLAMAIVYLLVTALMWQRPGVRQMMIASFEPLGRTALSCYVSASVVFAALACVVDFREMHSVWPILGCVAAILVAQCVIARIWLSHFTQGPLEWVLRAATWRRVPQLVR